jgi:hypothetical protein
MELIAQYCRKCNIIRDFRVIRIKDKISGVDYFRCQICGHQVRHRNLEKKLYWKNIRFIRVFRNKIVFFCPRRLEFNFLRMDV